MNQADLIRHIDEIYHVLPEYPFARSPNVAVFRHQNNKQQGKWFALLMTVSADKLGLIGDERAILNVKVHPLWTGSLLGITGILPAYHMNKEHWVSILIDVLSDDKIKELIAESAVLTC